MIPLATIISRLFEPLVLQLLLILITALRAGIVGWTLVYTMTEIIGLVVVPPMVLLLWAIQSKKISNWDISNRSQRVKALALFLCLFAVDMVFIRLMDIGAMTDLFLFFAITLVGFFCITLFWKLSGHLSTATICIGILIHWYGWVWWPLLLLLPVLAWSRVALKRHTTAQTVGGILFGMAMVGVGITRGLI
jgi:hypothetical protein